MDSFEYLRSFIERDSLQMSDIEKSEVLRDDIQPGVEPELGKFLGLLIRMVNAQKVLEIGSGIGYSSLWLGEAVKTTGGKVVTIDNHERTHLEVLGNIKSAGLESWVEKKLGDAEDVLSDLSGSWDIIFQDSGKYLYTRVHERLVDLLRPGGLIVADDTLFKVNSSVRKGLGDHMDRYNRLVFADKRLYSTILPVGHGITISYKIG